MITSVVRFDLRRILDTLSTRRCMLISQFKSTNGAIALFKIKNQQCVAIFYQGQKDAS